jgi:hypothetical protein
MRFVSINFLKKNGEVPPPLLPPHPDHLGWVGGFRPDSLCKMANKPTWAVEKSFFIIARNLHPPSKAPNIWKNAACGESNGSKGIGIRFRRKASDRRTGLQQGVGAVPIHWRPGPLCADDEVDRGHEIIVGADTGDHYTSGVDRQPWPRKPGRLMGIFRGISNDERR